MKTFLLLALFAASGFAVAADAPPAAPGSEVTPPRLEDVRRAPPAAQAQAQSKPRTKAAGRQPEAPSKK